jgi:hypothetical protein
MSRRSTEFHKIWIDRCAATEDIRQSFGQENALDYLIGEKLFAFLMASEQDPLFAGELPAFAGEIRRIFPTAELGAYFDHLERTKFLAPLDTDLEIDGPDDEIDELLPENPVMGAEDGRRAEKRRQESEGFAATVAKTAANPDPIVVLIMSLFAAASMTDDGILRANRAVAQNDFRTRLGPIGFEVVLRGGK